MIVGQDFEIVRYLVKTEEGNKKRNYDTALQYASEVGRKDILRYVLNKGYKFPKWQLSEARERAKRHNNSEIFDKVVQKIFQKE